MEMIIELAVTAGIAVILVYYVRDVTRKVLAKHFELREELGELESRFSNLKNELESEIGDIKSSVSSGERGVRDEVNKNLREIEEKLKKLESSLRNLQKFETKANYELGSVKLEVEKTNRRVDSIEEKLEKTGDVLKEELKEELLSELEEEIEHLEEAIERRKQTEVEEFLEVIKAAVTLQPEKLSSGMAEAKRALLSLRDIAKVYVLTGRGQREFRELKANLVELLKSLRKLTIVSIPDENVYAAFNDIIVKVKRLDIPMRVERDGKERELNPEKSFIRIHKMVYELAGELDRIADELQEPIPVTPVEKEFYEKLRRQFEELEKLEEQVRRLILKLNTEKETIPREENESLEDILRDLGL